MWDYSLQPSETGHISYPCLFYRYGLIWLTSQLYEYYVTGWSTAVKFSHFCWSGFPSVCYFLSFFIPFPLSWWHPKEGSPYFDAYFNISSSGTPFRQTRFRIGASHLCCFVFCFQSGVGAAEQLIQVRASKGMCSKALVRIIIVVLKMLPAEDSCVPTTPRFSCG